MRAGDFGLVGYGVLGRCASMALLGALTLSACGDSQSTSTSTSTSTSGGGGGGSTSTSTAASGTGGTPSTSSTTSASSSASGGAASSSVSTGSGGTGGGTTDPAPISCDHGGLPPAQPGGTAECPADKNLPGCACTTEAETAACWTGLRKNRGAGDCKDGVATCKKTGSDLAWGDCVGEVLPIGSSGKASCAPFTTGYWKVDNLSPCFVSSDDGQGHITASAISTVQNGGQYQCPSDFDAAPASPWSTDQLTADSAGVYTLCYTLKAGDPKNPLPADCTMVKDCLPSTHYTSASVAQTFPALPGWLADPSASACVLQFQNQGGYGEMSVTGQTDECVDVDRVFQTVTYCPLSCSGANPPPVCSTCQSGGGGTF